MLNVAIVNPAEDEELALTLSGRKKKLKDSDFEKAFVTCGIPAKVFSNLKKKYIKLFPEFCDFIDSSFLDDSMKESYKALLAKRLGYLQCG